jgi:membrane fusion protein, multidrug efflux system
MKTRCILTILIVLLLSGCKNAELKTGSAETVRVRITNVNTTVISIPVHSSGVLVSSEELKLSFKTGGIVANILVKEGDRVKKGDLLASLNLSEIRASEAQAKSSYNKAERDFKRAENLFRDSVATLEQKQNAATALNVAKSALEIVQFNLSHSRIFAPDNGLILRQFVKVSELVSPGYPVFLFGSSGKYWKIKTALSDKDVVKINQGDSATITVDAYPGMKFSAVVDLVGEISNPFTGTYEVELILQETDQRLASGFVAGIDLFPLAKKTLSIIPVGSIVEADGHQGYIFIISDTMTAQKVRIDIETIIGSNAAVRGIPDGIKEVVSEGVAYLKDGMKAVIVK